MPDLQSGVAGSNHGRGYFAPRSTQPSIPPGSVNEYRYQCGWEAKGRYGSFRLRIDERVGVHCADKTVKSLENTCHIPERFCGGDPLYEEALGYIKCMQLYLYLGLRPSGPPPPAMKNRGYTLEYVFRWVQNQLEGKNTVWECKSAPPYDVY